MKRYSNHYGFTIIELLVVVSVIALMIGILLPSLAVARNIAKRMQNGTQIRGIHSGMIVYAQDNRTRYPVGPASAKFEKLFTEGLFTAAYLVSPMEVKTIWTTGTFTTDNYSYSMLETSIINSARFEEFGSTGNSEAVVISDRMNNGTAGDPTTYRSIHSQKGFGDWFGNVGWNDNHVTWEKDTDVSTRYGNAVRNENDELFDTAATTAINSAHMVYDLTP